MTTTIAQQLKIKDFPFVINDKDGNVIYYENSTGFWVKKEYDSNGNGIRYEESNGFWSKSERDANGIEIRYEDSTGYTKDNRQWPFSKAIVELTLQQIADKMGIKVEQLRIKD